MSYERDNDNSYGSSGMPSSEPPQHEHLQRQEPYLIFQQSAEEDMETTTWDLEDLEYVSRHTCHLIGREQLLINDSPLDATT